MGRDIARARQRWRAIKSSERQGATKCSARFEVAEIMFSAPIPSPINQDVYPELLVRKPPVVQNVHFDKELCPTTFCSVAAESSRVTQRLVTESQYVFVDDRSIGTELCLSLGAESWGDTSRIRFILAILVTRRILPGKRICEGVEIVNRTTAGF